jgi:Zn finger protein HypA/HybF involved in hydrogenase expression
MCAQRIRGQRDKDENSKTIIAEFQKVHGDKYDYSGVVYKGVDVDVEIRCKACGSVFLQTPACHKNGGCKKCADQTRGKIISDRAADRLIDDFVGIHGDRYDYSKVVYQGDEVAVDIGCKKCGRSFYQDPGHHKSGNGCPRCSESHGERMIDRVLTMAGIDFERQKKFEGCRNKMLLPFDFYLTREGTQFVIEYNGAQHYMPVERFGGTNAFVGVQERDAIKKRFCDSAGIRHIEIPYWISSKREIKKMLVVEGVLV